MQPRPVRTRDSTSPARPAPSTRPKPFAGPPGELIVDDRTCHHCEYPLKGLRIGMACPECGTPSGAKPSARYIDESLADAPLNYLKRLRLTCFLLAAGSLMMIVGPVAVLIGGRGAQNAPAALLADFLLSALWYAAVVLVTRPRCVEGRSPKALASEWSGTRRWSLATQWLWIASALLDAYQAYSGTSVPLRWLNISLSVGSVAGFAPFGLHLARVADWARDDSLSQQFRVTGFGLALCLAIITLCAIVTFALPGMIAWTAVIIPLAYTGLIVGLIVFQIATFRLASMAAWAVSNKHHVIEKDQRLRERAARERADHMAGRYAPLDPKFIDRSWACARCGYELQGLKIGGTCPECGEPIGG